MERSGKPVATVASYRSIPGPENNTRDEIFVRIRLTGFREAVAAPRRSHWDRCTTRRIGSGGSKQMFRENVHSLARWPDFESGGDSKNIVIRRNEPRPR